MLEKSGDIRKAKKSKISRRNAPSLLCPAANGHEKLDKEEKGHSAQKSCSSLLFLYLLISLTLCKNTIINLSSYYVIVDLVSTPLSL